MARLRGLLSASVLCLLAGLAGGLALGYVLSQQGAWLTPVPWTVYLAALLVAIGTVTWLDERRRLRVAEAAWPLPPGYGLEDVAPLSAALTDAHEAAPELQKPAASAVDNGGADPSSSDECETGRDRAGELEGEC